MVEGNNDLFLHECHDHLPFYKYSSLYEILLLLLPLAICCTALIYDKYSEKFITFEELYFILSLIGICYQPLRNLGLFYISATDALHSFERISKFFQREEEEPNQFYQKANNNDS